MRGSSEPENKKLEGGGYCLKENRITTLADSSFPKGNLDSTVDEGGF